MPYASVHDVPDYVPKDARPQWREVFNSVYERTNGDTKEKEQHAFAAANGVAIKALGAQMLRKSLDILRKFGDAGWYGVDFDNTLVNWETGGPNDSVVVLVQCLLAEGKEVRVVTARVASCLPEVVQNFQRTVVQDWCEKAFGTTLLVTAEKDPAMIMLYDDRATPVIGGRILQFPPDHVGGTEVPAGGSNCLKCKFLKDKEQKICGEPNFILWNGSAVIPGDLDSYCSDWFVAP